MTGHLPCPSCQRKQVFAPKAPGTHFAGCVLLQTRAVQGLLGKATLHSPRFPPAQLLGHHRTMEPAPTWLFLQPEANFLPSGDQEMLSTQCR